MELCFATEDRIDAIMKLERACISPPWTHGQMLAELYNDCSRFLVAMEGETPAGFAVLRASADEAELLRIVTDPGKRRRGIASHLLSAVLDIASSQEACRVFLEVRESNTAARALYEKHGFKAVGTRKKYFTEPEENAVIMSMEVKNADRKD